MRPPVLNPLFAPVSTLPGIGPRTAPLFDTLLGRAPARVLDLLFHHPQGVIDRRARPTFRDATLDTVVTIAVRVVEHRPAPRGRGPTRVLVEDDTGDCQLVFFLSNAAWIDKMLPVGARRWISGRLEMWDGRLQMVHPQHVVDDAGLAALPMIEPVYGLTEGLKPRAVAKTVAEAVKRVPALPEWLDPPLMALRSWPSFGDALRALHAPAETLDPRAPARLRLAYDELLASQLALALLRASARRRVGRAHVGRGDHAARLEAALPFRLTAAQSAALAEIRADLASPNRMSRLLQGDVGSGKTAVALLAMASVAEAGRQSALMAPTEILARQHGDKLGPLAESVGLRLAVLTGRDTASTRARIADDLMSGAIDILVGTHALIENEVAFRDLGLAVIDEQHRFGVHQRLALSAKGAGVDLLVMTATPIPRTLVMTAFGDMDVSVLREKPAGRQPIDTRALPMERLDDVVAAVGRAIRAGQRIYWVCPLVEESEELDLSAAVDRHDDLVKIFGQRVGLVHGQMKPRDKDAVMAAFATGELDVLVATTVIEVGVDVPDATIMVVEHAERFGLAQLHQLRGRVGRGSGKSSCVLLYKGPLGEVARARIDILRESEDGFRIAEEDLRLRGEGEVLGTRQSGLPGFRIADLALHADLLAIARDDARLVLERDAALKSARGEALRVLLYLFERDEAIRLLRAG